MILHKALHGFTVTRIVVPGIKSEVTAFLDKSGKLWAANWFRQGRSTPLRGKNALAKIQKIVTPLIPV